MEQRKENRLIRCKKHLLLPVFCFFWLISLCLFTCLPSVPWRHLFHVCLRSLLWHLSVSSHLLMNARRGEVTQPASRGLQWADWQRCLLHTHEQKPACKDKWRRTEQRLRETTDSKRHKETRWNWADAETLSQISDFYYFIFLQSIRFIQVLSTLSAFSSTKTALHHK